jgi:CRP/FNR family cyclic AMP-dependent transcriptional regulator
MSDDVLQAISANEVFGCLPPAEREQLAGRAVLRSLSKGDRAFVRGDDSNGMFVLVRGSVALTVDSSDGNEVLLAVLRAPQSFGELAVIDGGPRAASAVAREPSTLLCLPTAEVRRLVRTEPDVAQALLHQLASLLRRVDDSLSDLVLVDLSGRVAQFLADAAAAAPVRLTAGGGVPLDLRLTQTELARLVGGSRQQVNRVIVNLAASGAIERSGSRIVAVRPELLPRQR